MDVEKTIRQYLPQIIHMSLATCDIDQPWVCEVHFVYDEGLNIYFRSTLARRHSGEIGRNPKVAGNMITQHFLGQKVRGVYFEGVAELLEDVDEDHIAYKLYCDRFETGRAILDELTHENGHHFYKITVENFFLFDCYDSPTAIKHTLPWGGGS